MILLLWKGKFQYDQLWICITWNSKQIFLLFTFEKKILFVEYDNLTSENDTCIMIRHETDPDYVEPLGGRPKNYRGMYNCQDQREKTNMDKAIISLLKRQQSL